MSKYVRRLELEIPFDDGTAKVVLHPLKRDHLFEIQALLPKVGADGKVILDQNSGQAFSMYSEMLAKEYIIESAVLDASGTPVPPEEWTKAAYFAGLVGACMAEHIRRSMPANPSS